MSMIGRWLDMRRDNRTRDLFEVPQPAQPIPASMDYRAQVSATAAEMMKNADCDRHDLAARCSRLTGTDVSKHMLDAYASEARDTFNLPFWFAPILETSCVSHDLSNWLAGVRGGRLLVGRDALTAELGKLERTRDEAARLIRDLKKQMGGRHV